MPTGQQLQHDPRHEPLTCPWCGGRAPLRRMAPDGFSRGKFELWTYECVDCSHRMEELVEHKK